MFGLNNSTNDNQSLPTQIPSVPSAPPLAQQAGGDDQPDMPDNTPPASATDLPGNEGSVVNQPQPPDLAPPPPVATDTPAVDLPIQDELLSIKQQALQNLAPLVKQLDQTPEERFKTTMMMIQASDNANLIKEAYEAANSITDDKGRASAILDVINEINYFTHNKPEANGPNPPTQS